MRVFDIPPRPSSLIESIRAIGYSLSTALADVVDNSIAARAETIQIFASLETSDPKVGIVDDGAGMTEDELLEAMRLGSRSPLEERAQFDLGRFGLGLKTASFSQCRVLTVVTRTNGTNLVCSVEPGPHCRVRQVAGPDTRRPDIDPLDGTSRFEWDARYLGAAWSQDGQRRFRSEYGRLCAADG